MRYSYFYSAHGKDNQSGNRIEFVGIAILDDKVLSYPGLNVMKALLARDYNCHDVFIIGLSFLGETE